MLKRCEDTNLVLNWEKYHFMVKEGIVLSHKILKSRIEVDRAKVDVIAKLPPPTSAKGIWSFLGSSSTEKLIESLSNTLALLTQSYKSHSSKLTINLELRLNAEEQSYGSCGKVVVQDCP
ncbi:hypothetical protein Tco_0294485 [Tanacetum coccineum]